MPEDAPPMITKDFITPYWMSERTVKLDQRIRDYVRDLSDPHPINVNTSNGKVDLLVATLQSNKFADRLVKPNNMMYISTLKLRLPIQNQLNINQAVPTKNPQVFDLIVNSIISAQTDKQNITEYNLIDLGIVPLNLNMMMKDVSLFNVTFNSALYKKFMTTISSLVHTDKLNESINRAKTHFMNVESNSLGLA